MLVGNATPGQVSSVGVAAPGSISGVGDANGSNLGVTYDPQNGGGSTGNVMGLNTVYVAPTPAPDPYAKYGGIAEFNKLLANFGAQEQGVMTSANSALDTTAGKYNRSILDFIDNQRLKQGQIDSQGIKTDAAKLQGVQGIQGMISRGIRSAGTMLGNKNASDSSATEAIANAYGKTGQVQMGQLGNQYELGMQDLANSQNEFNVQQASGLRNLQGSKEDSVNTIVSDVSTQLASLNAQMANADMPTRIGLEQRAAEIKQSAVSKLQALDTQLIDGTRGINPLDAASRLSRAGEMNRAGTNLGADAFQYQSEAPMNFTGNAPSGGGLPLYTMARGRRAA